MDKKIVMSAALAALIATPAYAAPDVTHLGKREVMTLDADGTCRLDVEFKGPKLVVVTCVADTARPTPRAAQPSYTLTAGETIRVEAGSHQPAPCGGNWRLKVKVETGNVVVVKCGRAG